MSLKKYREKIKQHSPDAVLAVKQDLSFQIAKEFERNRIARGLTQQQLAAAIGTQQSGIARLERGSTLPSLRFLKKITDEIGAYIDLKIRTIDEPQFKATPVPSVVINLNMTVIAQNSVMPVAITNHIKNIVATESDFFGGVETRTI